MNPFDKLKGINAPREIKIVKESTLERLIKLNRELESEITIPDDWYWEIHEFRLKLYDQISKRAGDYDVQDISNLTTALSFEESKNQRTRGAYIGGLLSLLTEKNHKLNKETTLEIDLNGREFPYLLFACKYVDTLKISNVKGDYVGSNIARNNGNAGAIFFDNMEGNWVGSGIAYDGNAGIISFNDLKGNWVGSNIARNNGNARVISFNNGKGDNVGSRIARDNGKCNILDKEGKYSSKIKQFIEMQRQKYQNINELNKDIQEFIGSLK
ncbi:MAG: hypothetical protein AABW65_03350 [Nanoarchaeota archaeon]